MILVCFTRMRDLIVSLEGEESSCRVSSRDMPAEVAAGGGGGGEW